MLKMGRQNIDQVGWREIAIKTTELIGNRTQIDTLRLEDTRDLQKMINQIRLMLQTMLRNNRIIPLFNLTIPPLGEYIAYGWNGPGISAFNLSSTLHQLPLIKKVGIINLQTGPAQALKSRVIKRTNLKQLLGGLKAVQQLIPSLKGGCIPPG